MLTFSVNWLAVVVSIIANMVIGALWYGPLFGKRWMQELGLTMEDIQSGQMWQPYLIAILNSFLMAFVLANAVAWTGVSGVAGGLKPETTLIAFARQYSSGKPTWFT